MTNPTDIIVQKIRNIRTPDEIESIANEVESIVKEIEDENLKLHLELAWLKAFICGEAKKILEEVK